MTETTSWMNSKKIKRSFISPKTNQNRGRFMNAKAAHEDQQHPTSLVANYKGGQVVEHKDLTSINLF